MGPRIYIPARIHPHLGGCFAAIQLAAQRDAVPAKGSKMQVRRRPSSFG